MVKIGAINESATVKLGSDDVDTSSDKPIRLKAAGSSTQSFTKSLSQEGDSGGAWDGVNETRTNNLAKGTTVIRIKFWIFTSKGENPQRNQHLKRYQKIDSHASCIALALL